MMAFMKYILKKSLCALFLAGYHNTSPKLTKSQTNKKVNGQRSKSTSAGHMSWPPLFHDVGEK